MRPIAFKKRGECLSAWKVISALGLLLLLSFGQTAPVLGNPTGGTVVAGSATIGGAGPTLTINQSTTSAIINWQQFSIASGELTKFLVPTSSSATLNRVFGGNPSLIYGSLQSNGILYLVNPSGIVVGPSGRIDTAGFLASTLDISNEQFLAGGDLEFSGASGASIDNEGTIHASSGDVYLIANQVSNNGTLSAPQGTVGLAAGSDVLFQQAGSQHLFVEATPAGTTRATGVTNAGTIRAAAAELKSAGGNAYALAINNTGEIAATGYKKVNGQVYLVADGGNITNSGQISAQTANGNGGTIVLNGHGTSSTGTVLNSGSLLATGTASGTTGGTVEVLGNQVGITGQGVVDVSGDAGGGTALIGGDEHGANPAIPDADQTYLGPDAAIVADALTLGMGGKVILWGNETTQVYGQISATGGAQGGNGGFVETSAAALDVLTAPDLFAPYGANGTWLLDPSTVTISDSVSDSGFSSSPAFTITSGTVTVSQATLLTALESGNVTINASQGTGGGGTITWTESSTPFDISNAGGNTLTLDAPVALTINGVTVNATGTGGLNLVLNSFLTGAGSVNVQSSTFNLNGGGFTANGNGYASSSDAAGEANGVNLFDTTINAEGGTIALTGNAGYTSPGGGLLDSGLGVAVGTDGETNVALTTTGTGNIILVGTGNQAITSQTLISGVDIYQDDSASNINNLSVVNGTISITGTVSAGTASGASIVGVEIEAGSVLQATGTGSITLAGVASGATSLVSGATPSFIEGVAVSGNLSVTSGGITLVGTGGTINTSNSTLAGNSDTPSTTGIVVDTTAQITTGANATITMLGTGGAVTTTGAYTGESEGVVITDGSQVSMGAGGTLSVTGFGGAVNAGNGANAGDASSDGVDIGGDSSSGSTMISVATGGIIIITGTGDSIDASHAAQTAGDNNPDAVGVSLDSGADLAAAGTTTITIMGTGGSVNSGSNTDGDAIGVDIGSGDDSSLLNTVVSSVSGQITITGIAGSTPNVGIGAVVHGFKGKSTTVESTTGNIIVTGTGGSGYTGSGVISGNSVPNYGFALVDNATLMTGGAISLTGTGGANSSDIAILELTGAFSDPTLDSAPVTPVITSGGAFSVDALSSTGIDLDANVTAASATLTGSTMALGGSFTSAGTVTFDTTGAITDTGSVQVVGFILQNGSWQQNALGGTLPAFSATSNFELQNSSTFLRVVNGNGSSGSPYQITDVYGLQGLGSPGESLFGAAAELVNNINATGTASWNSGAGFVPIGGSSSFFTGTFNGQGYTINGLYINTPDGTNVGLFSETETGAVIENVGLTNAQVTGDDAVGALVGDSVLGTITNTYSTGVVNAFSNVGGLAGGNGGTISISYSTCTVGGSDYVGGLVGTNYGTIGNSYSTGAVSGSLDVGGLVGYNYNSYGLGTITNTYSTGAVTGSSTVGGLLGFNDSTTISNSFWDTDTAGSGVVSGVGSDEVPDTTPGVTASTTAELKSQSYILANAPTTPTWDFTTVWTTDGGTLTPQLTGLPPTVTSGLDTLSGTAYVGSGVTDSPDVTIDLIYDGSLLGSTTTSGSGVFSFSVSSSDLTGGILLTDATDNGNTYYQANSPALTITGVDLWGGTLRVLADTASNTALKTAAGSLSSNGINYVVSGTNLSTNSGVNMAILSNYAQDGVTSNYTLDGSITAGGTLSTSANSTLTGSAPVTLTASAMALAGSLTSTGTVTFDATGAITDTGSVQVVGFILQNGSWQQNALGETLPAFSATSDFELQNGSTFLRVANGDGSLESPYQITDVYGLQGLGSPSESLLGDAAELINNINATGTSSWNSGAGFVPIGDSVETSFTGTFNGQNHTINGLYINTPSASYVGLFGSASSAATIQNVGVLNVQISGNFETGALVGGSNATISDSFSTGSVTGGSTGSFIGGLVGGTSGTLDNVFSLASVSGNSFTGGLVGANGSGTILNAYSAGMVTALGAESSNVGALLGGNLGVVNNTFWDTDTSGVEPGFGTDPTNTTPGFTAATTAQLESQSFILANAPTAPTWDFTSVWTTDGGTLTPQLIGLSATGLPTGSGGGSGGSSPSPPSTATGGAAGAGSTIVPPALVPQPTPPVAPPSSSTGTIGSAPPPPPFSFTGTGAIGETGQESGELADSSSSSGQVGAGDAAQLGDGGLDNVANAQASGALGQALGPVVYHNLTDALAMLGDWNAPDESGAGGDNAGGEQETILTGGDVAEMGDNGVKHIPLSQAPQQLRNAMSGDVQNGMQGAGH
jgi:filamentous hemagglutinin family protein